MSPRLTLKSLPSAAMRPVDLEAVVRGPPRPRVARAVGVARVGEADAHRRAGPRRGAERADGAQRAPLAEAVPVAAPRRERDDAALPDERADARRRDAHPRRGHPAEAAVGGHLGPDRPGARDRGPEDGAVRPHLAGRDAERERRRGHGRRRHGQDERERGGEPEHGRSLCGGGLGRCVAQLRHGPLPRDARQLEEEGGAPSAPATRPRCGRPSARPAHCRCRARGRCRRSRGSCPDRAGRTSRRSAGCSLTGMPMPSSSTRKAITRRSRGRRARSGRRRAST